MLVFTSEKMAVDRFSLLAGKQDINIQTRTVL